MGSRSMSCVTGFYASSSVVARGRDADAINLPAGFIYNAVGPIAMGSHRMSAWPMYLSHVLLMPSDRQRSRYHILWDRSRWGRAVLCGRMRLAVFWLSTCDGQLSSYFMGPIAIEPRIIQSSKLMMRYASMISTCLRLAPVTRQSLWD